VCTHEALKVNYSNDNLLASHAHATIRKGSGLYLVEGLKHGNFHIPQKFFEALSHVLLSPQLELAQYELPAYLLL